MEGIDYFDKQKGLISLVVYLNNNGCTNISRIRNKANLSFGVAYKCIDIMKDLGLIEICADGHIRKKRGPKTKGYHLTDKGREVAGILGKLDRSNGRSLGSNSQLDYLDNQTGLIKMILYLFRNKKAYFTEIQRKGGINTVPECLNLLDIWGYLGSTQESPNKVRKGFKTNHYYLTQSGEHVAEELLKIDHILDTAN